MSYILNMTFLVNYNDLLVIIVLYRNLLIIVIVDFKSTFE